MDDGIKDRIWQCIELQSIPFLLRQLACRPELHDCLSLLDYHPMARAGVGGKNKLVPRKQSASMGDMNDVKNNPLDPSSCRDMLPSEVEIPFCQEQH